MKKIGIDMDSVIADILSTMVQFHNTAYHTNLTTADHIQYDLSAVWGCRPEEVLPRVFEYYESPFFDTILPIPGAVDGVGYLKKKYELFLVTSRPHMIEEKTNRWINRFFPDTFKKVLHTNQVSHAHEKRKKKSEVCREEGITVMIDDAVDFAVDCAEAGIQVYLFRATWNSGFNATDNIRPVTGWEEIVTIL